MYGYNRCIEGGRQLYRSTLLSLFLFFLVFYITGCATTAQVKENRDPLEKINRPIHNLNHTLDTAILKPVAETYVKVIPQPVQSGVSNFFSNLGEPNVIVNDLLQGKLNIGVSDSLRFIVNSTLGIGGIIDVGTSMGLEKHHEDFGQTLAVWGFGEGPYLVIPLTGPTTLRDLPSRFVSSITNPLIFINENDVRIALGLTGSLNTRARHIDTIKTIDESAIDRYIYVREAYRDNRLFEIHDGNPPIEFMLEDDLFFDDEAFYEGDEDAVDRGTDNSDTQESPALESTE